MSEKTMRVQDYPLATRCPEHILTPTGKPLTDITLEKVLSGEVGPQDVRISRQTLEYQAQIAELSLIHISEPTRLGMISYAVFCLKKKTEPETCLLYT